MEVILFSQRILLSRIELNQNVTLANIKSLYRDETCDETPTLYLFLFFCLKNSTVRELHVFVHQQ